MGEVLPVLVVLTLATVLARATLIPFTERERSLLLLAFAGHMLGAFAQIWVARGFYGGGDMIYYHAAAALISRLVWHDYGRFFPELLELLFQGEPHFPVNLEGLGTATGSMTAFAALLAILLDDSMYAMCLVMAAASFFGELAIYRVFRETFDQRCHRNLLFATMLVPSTIFWTSGLLKESVAMSGFGWLVLGTHRLLRGRRAVGIVLIASGGLVVAAVKPYILIPYGLATGVWWFWIRAQRVSGSAAVVIRPIYFVLGGAFALGVMLAVGEVFPRYAISSIVETAVNLQTTGQRITGGSGYSLGASGERTAGGQLLFAPFALFTALFRPLFFETSSVPMAVNVLETTAITGLFIRAVYRSSWRRLWEITSSTPFLMFGLVFALSFGTAVGLASTNLGSLARYRVPLMPFYVALVAIWNMTTQRAQAPVRRKSRSAPNG